MSNNLFGMTTAILVGGVNVIATCIKIAMDHAFSFCWGGSPCALFPKEHSTETEFRHEEATSAQLLVLHSETFLLEGGHSGIHPSIFHYGERGRSPFSLVACYLTTIFSTQC